MIAPTPETTVVAVDVAEWRAWLEQHHATAAEAWLVVQKKASPHPGVGLHEAVVEALCHGWIDSLSRRHDDHARAQRFTPRRDRSRWSEVNRARALELVAAGAMRPAGYAALARARASGTWPDAPTA